MRAWVREALAPGRIRTCRLTEHVSHPWSTVWSARTDRGTFWFKENAAVHGHEGKLHAALAALAPEHVDRPVAVDPARRWLLTPDGGPTLMATAPATRGIELDTMLDLVRDYAQLQRRTLDQRDRLVRAGLPVRCPRGAPAVARMHADRLAATAPDDPRHIGTEQHRLVVAALPALEEAAAALETGPVPLAFDHADLWPQNVFAPRPGGRYRIFDFADARWAHPFGSLVMLATECAYRWQVPQPDDAVDLRDERIRTVFGAYLAEWADLAPVPVLWGLLRHALRIAPLHRSAAWLGVLDTAGPDALAEHGASPWAWLQDVAKPVLL